MKKTKVINQAFLEKEYLRLNGTKKMGDITDRRGVIMLAACVFGPSVDEIAKHLDYKRGEIFTCLAMMRKAGVLKRGKLAVDWFSKHGAVAFLCDVLAVEGILKRAR